MLFECKLMFQNNRTRERGKVILVYECTSTVLEDSTEEAKITFRGCISVEVRLIAYIKLGILIVYRLLIQKLPTLLKCSTLMESVAGGNRKCIVLGNLNIEKL